jgi:hypothetical protein
MRIVVAVVAGLLGFLLYVAAVVALADQMPRHWAVQVLYFVVAGSAWVVPARWLMLWAARMNGRNKPA